MIDRGLNLWLHVSCAMASLVSSAFQFVYTAMYSAGEQHRSMLEQGSSNRNLMSMIQPAGSGIVSGQSSVLMQLTPQGE